MRRIDIPYEDLLEYYINDEKTTYEIAKIFNCDDETIRLRLKEYNIKRRRCGLRFAKTKIKIPEKKEILAYVAGIVDGEGTIMFGNMKSAYKGKYPRVSIKNTDLTLMKWIEETFGGNLNRDPPKKKHYKMAYKWYIHGYNDIYYFLKAIYPYLIIKKDNCEKVRSWCKMRLEE